MDGFSEYEIVTRIPGEAGEWHWIDDDAAYVVAAGVERELCRGGSTLFECLSRPGHRHEIVRIEPVPADECALRAPACGTTAPGKGAIPKRKRTERKKKGRKAEGD